MTYDREGTAYDLMNRIALNINFSIYSKKGKNKWKKTRM